MQRIYSIIQSYKCVKRVIIIDTISKEFNITKDKAEDIVDKDLKRLIKYGLIERKGNGFYCVKQP